MKRLDAVDGHLVSNEDFRSGQALSSRIDAAQAFAKQASMPSRTWLGAASAGVLVLKATVEHWFCPHASRKADQAPPPSCQRPAPHTRQAQPNPNQMEFPPFSILAWSIAGANGFCRLHLRIHPSARSTSFAKAMPSPARPGD